MTTDKGYSWVILLVNFFTQAIGFGIVWSVGVYYEMFLLLNINATRGEIALICSLNTAAFYGIGMFSLLYQL